MVVGVAALGRVWNPLLSKVQTGLDGGEAWTPQQYSVIVQTILSSSHQAVPVSIAKASIGKAALEALVQANLLSYRPLSSEGPNFLLMICLCMPADEHAKHQVQQSPRQGCTSCSTYDLL